MDNEELQVPYYEMTYLDDSNIKHLANFKNQDEVKFIKSRFDVLECNLIKQ